MPFAAFCKKCKKEKTWANLKDKSCAYMIGTNLNNIEAEVSKHFKNVHDVSANPAPQSLSWNKDFREVEFELSQYGIGIDRDVSHLTFIFKGPSVRQFDSDDYTISVITRYHYNQCLEAIKNKTRIDLSLFEYF